MTTIGHAEPHGNIAFELFFPTGPFAILPMLDGGDGGHRSAIVWTVPAHEAPGWLALTPAALAREMAVRMDGFLGALEILTPISSYPLRLQHAERLVERRLALVGDAAHVIHPIAGQGLNLGLRDVAALAQVLVEAARLGLDVGEAGVLAKYQRWRRLDIAAITAATDGLSRLFGLPGRGAATVTSAGAGGGEPASRAQARLHGGGARRGGRAAGVAPGRADLTPTLDQVGQHGFLDRTECALVAGVAGGIVA